MTRKLSCLPSERSARASSQPVLPVALAHRGFTLTELLLVIAIISMLLTISVPALSRAKQIAKRAVCQTNVRRLALAVQTYTAMYDSVLPPHRLPFWQTKDNIYINDYGRQKPRWPWFLQENAGPVIEKSRYDTDAEFQAATEMNNDNFLCPSLDDKYARDIRNGAYGYNHAYLGCGRPKSGTGNNYVPTNWPVRIDRIHNTSETVVLGDSRGAIDSTQMAVREHAYTLDAPRLAASVGLTEFGPKNDLDPSIPEKWKHSPAHERHLGKANVAFADTHSESLSLAELGYEVDSDGIVVKDAGNNELWTGTDGDEP